MWTKAFAAVLLVVVTLVAFSATRHTPVRDALVPNPSPAEAALDRMLPEVQLNGLPFDEAINRLEEAAKVRIILDWPRLDAVAPNRKARVYLRVRGVRLSDALSRLLADASSGVDSPPLDFAPDGGAVLVTTAGALSRRVFTRCYDVHDLVPPDLDPPPPGRSGGGLFNGPRPPDGEQERGSHLAYFIIATVAPDTWRESGGSIGLIKYLAGRMVVVQTWEHHREIEALLNTLRHPVPATDERVASEVLAWDARRQHWAPANPHTAEAALRTVLPEVKIENASLDAAVQTLAALARANIVVDGTRMMEAELDRRQLENAGFDLSRSRTRTLHLYDVTLQQALDAVVQEYSDRVWSGGFTVEGGAIVVTKESAASRLLTRVYDLRDWPDVGAAVRRHRPGSGKVANVGARLSDLQRLTDAIRATVAPDSWREKGGWAEMRYVADRLIVTQSWRNHEQIRRFMDLLRSDPPRPSGAAPATGPTSPRRE